MKHLLALIALCVAFAAGAQTGLVEFPYNPDADNDDIIGVNDLLELLSLFGGEFSEEALYMNSDSTSALYHASNSMQYYACHRACHELPGNWRIASRDDFYKTDISTMDQGVAWVRTDLSANYTTYYSGSNVNERYWNIYVGFTNSNNGRINFSDYNTSLNCYCATHERPKVEYSYCEGSDIQSCADAKVADGWYPLGGISSATNPAASGTQEKQAFWRWAE